jgi:hypothetical protein
MVVYNQGKVLRRAIYSNPRLYPHDLTAAKAKSQIIIILYVVFLQMVNHPLTDIGIKPVSLRLERVCNDE